MNVKIHTEITENIPKISENVAIFMALTSEKQTYISVKLRETFCVAISIAIVREWTCDMQASWVPP